MNRFTGVLLLGLTAALSSAAFTAALSSAVFADGTDTTLIPKAPKPDFSSMAFKVGTWNCVQKSARRPSPTTATITYSLDPTGYWLIAKATAPGVPWYPYPTVSTDSYTYDSDAKRWIDLSTDDGGGYSFNTSTGWSGDEIVWHEMSAAMQPDIASDSDYTETKVSDTKFTGVSSFTTKSGAVVGVTGTCTKQ